MSRESVPDFKFFNATEVQVQPLSSTDHQQIEAFSTDYPAIGEGSFGSVHLIEHATGNASTQYVVKIVCQFNRDALQQLQLEKHLLPLLRHPHVVHVLDPKAQSAISEITLPLQLAMVMKNYTHGDLYDALFDKNKWHPDIGQQLNHKLVAQQIASGLNYLHQKYVILRDLKPENVLLDEHNNAVLTDFGLAIVSPPKKTQPLQFAGTISMFAPETIELMLGQHKDSEPKASPAQDIYAFGILLLMMMRHQLKEDYLPDHFDRHDKKSLRASLANKHTQKFLRLTNQRFQKDNHALMSYALKVICSPDIAKRPTAAQLEEFFKDNEATPQLFDQLEPTQTFKHLLNACASITDINELRDQQEANTLKMYTSLEKISAKEFKPALWSALVEIRVLTKLAILNHKMKVPDQTKKIGNDTCFDSANADVNACKELVSTIEPSLLKTVLRKNISLFESKLRQIQRPAPTRHITWNLFQDMASAKPALISPQRFNPPPADLTSK